jgi:hypothetical protein
MHGCFVKTLSRGGATYAAAVFAAGMFGDLLLSSHRAARKQFSDAAGESLNVLVVQLRSSLSLTLAPTRPHFTIGQAFSLSFL